MRCSAGHLGVWTRWPELVRQSKSELDHARASRKHASQCWTFRCSKLIAVILAVPVRDRISITRVLPGSTRRGDGHLDARTRVLPVSRSQLYRTRASRKHALWCSAHRRRERSRALGSPLQGRGTRVQLPVSVLPGSTRHRAGHLSARTCSQPLAS